jgi:hypothetical protein
MRSASSPISPARRRVPRCLGDREWTVAAVPRLYLAGKRVTVKFGALGDPGAARVEDWGAHEKVTVRRKGGGMTQNDAEAR